MTSGKSQTIDRTSPLATTRPSYGNAQVERIRVLNGTDSNAQVVPGEKYKIVVRG